MVKDFSPVSFRDPDARLHLVHGRVLRFLRYAAAAPVLDFIQSPGANALVAAKQLVSSVPRDPSEIPLAHEEAGVWLEHERIWFASFPFEWAPEMLYQAGLVTLGISEVALRSGYELKDGTPFNILFTGSQAVFIDISSVQTIDPASPTWHAYAQFVQSFLLPLLAHRITGMRMDWVFSASREGVSPSEMQGFPGLWRSAPGRQFVLLPRLFEGRGSTRSSAAATKKGDVDVARFIRRRLYRGLGRHLKALYPQTPAKTDVTQYSDERAETEAEQTAVKRDTIFSWLQDLKPGRVLDVGANTGDYSMTAAKLGARVVAIDKVPGAVSLLYRRALQEGADIQTLLVDLMRPTPAIGWRNAEHPSFLERAGGQFDAVLFLAVIHHVLINDRVPLPHLFSLLAELTTSSLIIEFVARQDPNFVRVARGRDSLFIDYTQETFEAAAKQVFRIETQRELPGGTRTLYLLQKDR